MYVPWKLIFLFPTGYSVAAGEFSGDGVEGKSTNQVADTASIRWGWQIVKHLKTFTEQHECYSCSKININHLQYFT